MTTLYDSPSSQAELARRRTFEAWLCDSLSAQLLHQRLKCPLISPQIAIGPDLVFASRSVWKRYTGCGCQMSSEVEEVMERSWS